MWWYSSRTYISGSTSGMTGDVSVASILTVPLHEERDVKAVSNGMDRVRLYRTAEQAGGS